MSYLIDQRIILFWKKALICDNSIIQTLATINKSTGGLILSKYNLSSINISVYGIKQHMWKHFVECTWSWTNSFLLGLESCDCVFSCLHFMTVLLYHCITFITFYIFICCLCVINGWMDGYSFKHSSHLMKNDSGCWLHALPGRSSSTVLSRLWANFLPQTCIAGLVKHLLSSTNAS